jgi:hypothetical protein
MAMNVDGREATDGRFFGDSLRGVPADLATRRIGLLLWGLPILALVFTAVAAVGPLTRALVWTVSLAWLGAACLANAWRSGRVHCHITGPFFLLLAALSLAHGLGVVSLGPRGWRLIGAVLGVGTPLLTFVPEWIWGKYSGRDQGKCC